MKPNALTRVAIKRCKRKHPDWTDQRIFEDMKTLTDAAGAYSDQVTLLDVQGVIASMPQSWPGDLFKWNA